jgi:rhodanese-related sulfurtransferase
VDIPAISTEQLAQKLKSADIVLVDINAEEDANKFWIDSPKRVHIDLIDFDQKYQSLPKNKELIVMCLKGHRGPAAARFLAAKGYKNVKIVDGGIQKWVLEGRPVKKKQ